MNPLDNMPQVRKVLYVIQWVVTGIQTVLSAWFAIGDRPMDRWPEWFVASLAIAPVLWTYLGVTASKNTPVE